MAKKQVAAPAPAPANRPPYMLIEEIRVQGYKSLVDATIQVRPLTLLAGTNSSGKSSIMQPLLLIKQTMEAPYQPAGALVLDGAHVQAETAGELVSKLENPSKQFQLEVKGQNFLNGVASKVMLSVAYEKNASNFNVAFQHSKYGDYPMVKLTRDASQDELKAILVEAQAPRKVYGQRVEELSGIVRQQNGFIRVAVASNTAGPAGHLYFSGQVEDAIERLMHIPGLRGKAQRSYVAAAFDNQIKGTFDLYVAGTVSKWQQEENNKAIAQLNDYLRRLGLTDSVTAKVKNANEVELSVSRLPAGSKGKPRKADMVNIADVGIGVSQVLPILVALIAAQEGQIVYVEQPELHLHPRAQVAMAELLAEAANRGVRVIVETHSSLLLLTVQTLVAEAKIKPEDVALHWFERDAKGATTVRYEQPDENGAYGEWPEDFGDVEMTAQRAYLDAVKRRRSKSSSVSKNRPTHE